MTLSTRTRSRKRVIGRNHEGAIRPSTIRIGLLTQIVGMAFLTRMISLLTDVATMDGKIKVTYLLLGTETATGFMPCARMVSFALPGFVVLRNTTSPRPFQVVILLSM